MSINWEEISFGIIAKSGEAKSYIVESFKAANKDDFETAKTKLNLAEKALTEAGKIHMDVVVAEAEGKQHDFKVLFVHAEDQFLTTQTFHLTMKLLMEFMEKQGKCCEK